MTRSNPETAKILPTSGVGTKKLFVGSGKLVFANVFNNTGATLYFQKFDKATAPTASSQVPSYPPVAILDGKYYESDNEFEFTAGCWVAVSSDADVYTPVTADVFLFCKGV